MTKEYATMLGCVRNEIKYPNSRSYGPDWQQVEWEFHQVFPDMPEDEVTDLFNKVIDDFNIEDFNA